MTADPRSAGVFSTDRQMVVRSWDGWMADATGIPADAACGSPLGALFPEVARRGLLARLQGVADGDRVEVLAPALHQYLIPCEPREPSRFFTRMQQLVTLAPLREGDEIVGVVATVEDVTRRRDRERELADRLRGGDESARLDAVESLAAGDAPADLLVGAFADTSWRVRQVAVDAVARRDGEETSELLVRVLREQHRELSVLNATLSALARAGEDVTLALLDLLASPDPDLRVYVALALGHSGDARAVAALVGAIGDPNPNVQFHAVEALGRLRARAASPALLEVAEARDFALSFAALDALGDLGDETVVPRLLPFLADDLLSAAAVGALGRLGAEDAVAPLARLLAGPDAEVGEVADALAAIHARFEHEHEDGALVADLTRAALPSAGRERLVDALAAAREADRSALVRVLGWLDFDGVDPLLLGALAHAATREAAIDGLVRRGGSAGDALAESLHTLDEDALRGALAALGRIGSPTAVPALLRLLDAEPESALPVVAALAGIGDDRAVEPLLGLLDRPEAALRQAAIGALNSLGHSGLPARVLTLLDSPSARVRESAAKIAGYFAYPECLERMLDLAADEEDAVRRAAVEHLVYYDDPRAAGAVEGALRSDSPTVRAAAARAAARLPAPDAVRLVVAALADRDLWVRYYAARSAGSLASPAAVPTLSRLALDDPAAPVRIAAAEALGEIGASEAIAALALLAADENPEVYQAALRALSCLSHPDVVRPLSEALRSGDSTRERAALDCMEGEIAVRLLGDIVALTRGGKPPEVVRAAALALLRSGSEDGLRHLCRMAATPSRRETCVEVISRSPEAMLDLLAEELRDGEEEVRSAVVSALGRMRSPAAARLLATALEDASPAVRGAAAHALGRRDVREARGRAGWPAPAAEDAPRRAGTADAPR